MVSDGVAIAYGADVLVSAVAAAAVAVAGADVGDRWLRC